MRGSEAGIALTLVSDRRRLAAGLLPAFAAEAAAAGVDWIQIREKDLTARELVELARAVVAAVAKGPTRVLLSSRPDVALATGCDGVQLPEAGLPVEAVRRGFPGLRLGVSCHSLESARAAEAGGADFVLLGPVFPTPGKRPLGVGELARIASRVSIPVHAIGGIGPDTAGAAVAAGARGLAAIGVFHSGPLLEAVRLLRARVPA